MIKFIPKTTDLKSPLSDPEEYINNQQNKSLAAQLENRFIDVSCPKHPNFESLILFDFKDRGDLMTVQASCCPEFKQTLDLIATEKYPLPPITE